jgi:hypothetical protein
MLVSVRRHDPSLAILAYTRRLGSFHLLRIRSRHDAYAIQARVRATLIGSTGCAEFGRLS